MECTPNRHRRSAKCGADSTNTDCGTCRESDAGYRENRLEAALYYARELGWALIPLGRGKEPHFDLLPRDPATGRPVWRPLAERKADEAEIRRWFEVDPDCNIGVITGMPSGGLVIVDFDHKPPAGMPIPETPQSITFRGRHIYCYQPLPLASTKTKWGDVLAEGHYAVLPPSIVFSDRCPNGYEYRWQESLSPQDLDGFLAELPGFYLRDTKPGRGEASKEYSLLASPDGDTPDDSLPVSLRGLELGAWCARNDFVKAACPILGIPIRAVERLGTAFRCVLPGHQDKHPSASLYRRDDGLIVYRDWHGGQGEEWYYLAEIRASLGYRRAKKLRRPELATWQLRMLVETGFAKPAVVTAPPAPSELSRSARKVYQGFLRLLGIRWLHTPGEPTPFTWQFASAWCGVGERQAGEAMHQLLKLGLIQAAGRHRGTRLFLPGDRVLSPVENVSP